MKNKILLVCLAMIILIVPLGAGCGDGVTEFEAREETELELLQADYDSLKSDYNELLTDYDELFTSYESSTEDYDQVQLDYDDLQEDYDDLQEDYDTLETQYNELLDDYASLQDAWQYNYYMSANSDALQLMEALNIGHLLADYYEEIRAYHDDIGALNTSQESAEFAAGLARHSLGQAEWFIYESDYYDCADPQEYSYTTAEREFSEVMDLIDLQTDDSDVEKIEKILQFINDNIHYEHDLDDARLSPMETLAFQSGDCDDYATLGAAMFEYVGIDSAIGFFENTETETYHAMVLVHLNTISPYGCHYYADLTSLGLESGRWIIIEPQRTIEGQYTISDYDILVAAEV